MMISAEVLARLFHETYERLAPEFGYETREASRTGWDQVPENNKRLMTATAEVVLSKLYDEHGLPWTRNTILMQDEQ